MGKNSYLSNALKYTGITAFAILLPFMYSGCGSNNNSAKETKITTSEDMRYKANHDSTTSTVLVSENHPSKANQELGF